MTAVDLGNRSRFAWPATVLPCSKCSYVKGHSHDVVTKGHRNIILLLGDTIFVHRPPRYERQIVRAVKVEHVID